MSLIIHVCDMIIYIRNLQYVTYGAKSGAVDEFLRW